MKKYGALLGLALWVSSVPAEVRVFIEASPGTAWLKYECTAGEVVRAFALDVAVDQGRVVGISDFRRGESRPDARGYGIFPASFRDHITVTSGTNVNWEAAEYTPLAVAADFPGDTQPGLNSAGVTLEFGALWDPAVPGATPAATGTLCALRLSEAAQVSVGPNVSRGGVVPASADATVTAVYAGAWVEAGIWISAIQLGEGMVTIEFEGGELETASSVEGPWSGTGNTSGQWTEAVGPGPTKFFRVRR